MRTTRYLFTVIGLAALGLTACNNEDEPLNGGTLPDGAVHITATIEGMQTRAPQLDANGAGSFRQDDVWGLYTFTGDAANPSYSKQNIEHYADNRDKLLWEKLGEGRITFSAHYPRQTGEISNPTAYWFTPQGTVFEDDDLLFATATQSKGNKVELTFKHLMHRLVINLQTGAGMEGADLSGVSIETIDQSGGITMRATIPVNLLTGKLGEPMYDADYYSTGPDYDMIVVPQTLTAGAGWLTITLDGDTWYYPVPADLNTTEPGNQTRLESGQRLTLNLTLKKTAAGGNEVELTSSGIGGWNEQPTIEDDVTIPGDDSQTAYDALTGAIATATGTKESPTQITLAGDITMGDNDFITIGGETDAEARHITIDGGGKTITKGIKDRIFHVQNGSSLTLTNITLDGENRESGDWLVTAIYSSTITLGNGAVLQNLKNEISDRFLSIGVNLGGASTLVMNPGSSIENVEGHAVELVGSTNNRVIFNGGTLSGCMYDVYIVVSTAQINVAAWPTLDGDGKMNIYIGYSTAWGTHPVVTPKDSYPSLNLNNFTFKVDDYNNGSDITNDCEIFMDTDGIIKIKPKE